MIALPNSIAVYPGTFDPITNGHIDVIKRALMVVNKLVIAVAENDSKDPIFNQEQRKAMISEVMSMLKIDNDRVVVQPFKGLLVRFAESLGASLIIRGLRVISDFEYEYQMSLVNSKLSDNIATIFIPSSDKTQYISSRFVKEVAKLGGDVSYFVPEHVAQALKQYYNTSANQ